MHRALTSLLFALLAIPAVAAGVTRPELAAGRSIAVIVHSALPYGESEPAGIVEAVRPLVVEQLTKHKRFRVVDDPAKADLVCLYILYVPRFEVGRLTLIKSYGSSIVIMKGGADEHWDAGPLWMNTHFEPQPRHALPKLIKYLHADLQTGKNLAPPPPVSPEAAVKSDELSVFLTCLQDWSCGNPESILPAAAPHWKRVEDPARADFVVLWFHTVFSAAMVFRGGEPDWDRTPVAVAYRSEVAELRDPLEKTIAYLAEVRKPPEPNLLTANFGDVLPRPDPLTVRFPPTPGRSVIYIAREEDPVAKGLGVAVDGETVFELRALTCGRFTVDPGGHTIHVTNGSKREELHLFTAAGEVYFVMAEVSFGGVKLKQVASIDPDRVPQVLDREF